MDNPTRFSLDDQRTFAESSGDFNPMHVDPVAARRLITGRPVVHGVHLLLQALERWCNQHGETPAGVTCSFDQPVNVGDTVVFAEAEEAAGWKLTANVGDTVCTTVVLARSAEAIGPTEDDALPVRRVDAPPSALDEVPGSQQGTKLLLDTRRSRVAPRFPAASDRFGARCIDAVAMLSTFVGMVCPGLHSVFSSLRFTVNAAGTPDDLRFVVRRYDARFNLFIVHFSGAIAGEIRAFRRPPPQPQPSTTELATRVAPDAFAGTRALVVGGSRGLGELSAKLLAAGGAEVYVSYAAGRDDAEAVAADIAAAGRGRGAAMHLDVAQGDFATLPLEGPLTVALYFATPRIFRKKAAVFDAALHADFCHFYLAQFQRLCLWLEARNMPTGAVTRVYLPSTMFITERPKGMTEYTMAKVAAEVLADDLNRALRLVQVVHTRLPRLATDQTGSIMGLSTASNIDALLPVLQRVCAAG